MLVRMAAMNNVPAMTEAQRQELIAECQDEIAELTQSIQRCDAIGTADYLMHLQSQLQRQQIALAALTAKPFAYSYLHAAYEKSDGFAGWSHEFSLEHPPEWMLETGKVKDLRRLYADLPVLKLSALQRYEPYTDWG